MARTIAVLTDYLRRSWSAWKVAFARGQEFGAQSFGWVALSCVFDALRKMEKEGESTNGQSRCHLQ